MFSTNLLEFETRKNELHRQAAEYRLVKSATEPNPMPQKVLSMVGKLMISSGQQLVRNHRSAQTAQC
jgi:hypothetical protein